ncbi:MAG: heme-binding protein [Minicystis sp.]
MDDKKNVSQFSSQPQPAERVIPAPLAPVFQQPGQFRIAPVPAVRPRGTASLASAPAPSLGPLAAFTGTFTGVGFNCIFRPNFGQTTFPNPVSPPPPAAPNDNVLEMNITSETLSFSEQLGSVPNRGMVQDDIELNGVPYLQSISDITVPDQPIPIHLEPGLWVIVPATTDPQEGVTLARMASIPHGTTINAQGTFTTNSGSPLPLPTVDITPFVAATGQKIPFPSMTASNGDTARIPQDLSSFTVGGTSAQDLISNPNALLAAALETQTILSTTTITIDTSPGTPLFGGGTDNIAFLLGDSKAAKPNAQGTRVQATFWIETVQYTLPVPTWSPGDPPLVLTPQVPPGWTAPLPTFTGTPSQAITSPTTIRATATQIQYSQVVFLSFNGLTWPHASVNTLVPAAPIQLPPSAF